MAETTGTTHRFIQYFHFLPGGLFVACYHHLGYTFPIFYHKSLR